MYSKDYMNTERDKRYTYSIDRLDNKNCRNCESNRKIINPEYFGKINDNYGNKMKKNLEINENNNFMFHTSRPSYSYKNTPTFNYKSDLKNIGINYENITPRNFNNYSMNHFRRISPHYNSNMSTINNSSQDSNFKSFSNTLNNSFYNSNFQNYQKNDFENEGENIFSGLSELTKRKLKQIELSRSSNNLNLIRNNVSNMNKPDSNIQIYHPLNTSNYQIFYDKTLMRDDEEKNENKKIKNGKINKKKIIENLDENEINGNFINKKGILRSKKKILNKRKTKNESTIKIENEEEESEEEENEEIEKKNKFNKIKLKKENAISEQIIIDSKKKEHLENEFNKFLKEENEKLNKINYAYKQLLDSFFYFVNNLSHKFSYYNELFDISYYLYHIDDLSKTLIGLEHCILSHNQLLKEKSEVELKKMKEDMLNLFKSNYQLKLSNEISMQIPDPKETKRKLDQLSNFVNNLKQPLFSFKGIKEEINEEEKEDLNNNSNNNFIYNNNNSKNNYNNNNNLNNNKLNVSNLNNNSINDNNGLNNDSDLNNNNINDKHDCFACTLGCSVSQRGYSSMAYNPYIQNVNLRRSKSPGIRKENVNQKKIFSKKNSYQQIPTKY